MTLSQLVAVIICSVVGAFVGKMAGFFSGVILMLPLGRALGWELESLFIPFFATVAGIVIGTIAGGYIGFFYIH